MTSLTIGLIGICILLFLLLSGMPIGFGMGLIGFAGFAYIRGFEPAFGILKIVPYRTFAEHGLSVVPLFILMGSFCFYAGISKDLYQTVHKWIGHRPGGMAMATVGACAGFAAVSGSSLATAATMGTVALPEMKRYGYDDRLATGAVACGGTIGILIPPSVALIIYGVITEQSIGKLFLAGFIPGVLEAVFYIFTIAILCRLNPNMGPPGPRISLGEKIASFKNTWIVVALFVLVIGGIYTGIFSPTEAAGVGAFGAFVFALARRRLTWETFKASLITTCKTSAMIFIILLGAIILGYFLSVSRLPFQLAGIIGDLPVNRYVILVLILLLYVVLGCVMDALAIMLLITPIFFPLIMSLGFNPIWFAILIVRVSEIGMITPPVGINVFVIKGVAKDVPMATIYRGIIPFLIADVLHVALLIFFPAISLFLPELMM
jgi:C4-dicarboxylate transporter, DctM subunit